MATIRASSVHVLFRILARSLKVRATNGMFEAVDVLAAGSSDAKHTGGEAT
jgi:hypothetical protein